MADSQGHKTTIPSINSVIEWGIQSHHQSSPFTHISVSVTGWVTINPDEPQELAWFFEQSEAITGMLSYLAGTSMSPDAIEGDLGEDHRTVSVLFRGLQAFVWVG